MCIKLNTTTARQRLQRKYTELQPVIGGVVVLTPPSYPGYALKIEFILKTNSADLACLNALNIPVNLKGSAVTLSPRG